MFTKDCSTIISIDCTTILTNFKSLMAPVQDLKFKISRKISKLMHQSSIMGQFH